MKKYIDALSSRLRTIITVMIVQLLAGCGGPSGPPSTVSITVPPVPNACARFAAGDVVQIPPDLFSSNGALSVDLSYQTTTDAEGRMLFCFMTPNGLENPTLHIKPGDHLIINLTNNTPVSPVEMRIDPPNCGAAELTGSSVNMHFHGTNTAPTCGQDEVIHTLVNSGQSLHYDISFPTDEPPGLYWYHPHAHMLVESALQGGASGAIIVQGIQNFQPAVAGLEQRILLVRDQTVAGNPEPGGDIPSWDLTLNNVPIAYPAEIPAVIQMPAGKSQLWSVSNSSSDSILDLQVQFDGVPQTLQIAGLDGVPTGSQDGDQKGELVNATNLLIPTAGRAEFIVPAPPATVKSAALVTLGIDTGPDGDNDPPRTLASIQTVPASRIEAAAVANRTVSPAVASRWKERFEGLAVATAVTERTLFFSENNPLSQFFITQVGETPTLFEPNLPPAIVTTQGSVEDWTVENRTLENHEFHIHQLHFLVLAQNNFEANGSEPDAAIQGQVLDTIQVPFWDGNPTHPFPSVKLRMDFRGPDIGDFVFHCHIAEHEDKGMMAIIRVMPSGVSVVIERMRLYLASLGSWSGAARRASAWCVSGRTVLSQGACSSPRCFGVLASSGGPRVPN